jgi:hypothetical protein
LAHDVSWKVQEENTGRKRRKSYAKDAEKKEGRIALGINSIIQATKNVQTHVICIVFFASFA